MQRWETFAVISGGAAAALAGLLFVAVSIRIDVISASQELRNRAAETLVLFVTVLFVSLLLSIPDQTRPELGGELLGLSVLMAALLTYLDRRAEQATPEETAGPRATAGLLAALAPNTVTLVLVACAAVLLLFGLEAGLYLIVVPVVVAFLGGLASAWLLLTIAPS